MPQDKILELTLGEMVTHSEKGDDTNDYRLVTYHIQENKQVHKYIMDNRVQFPCWKKMRVIVWKKRLE